MPAVVAAWDDPSIADQPLLDAVLRAARRTSGRLPAVSTWTQVSTLLGKAMEAVARGTADAADAMADVQTQADGIGTE